MRVAVCSITATEREEIAVCFSLEERGEATRQRLILSAEQLRGLRLSVGECTAEDYERALRAARLHEALRRGLSSLAYGACSSGRLIQKLRAKGIGREFAEEAVRILLSEGYLSDEDNAVREAEKCVSKGWGKRRILSDLCQKGYSKEAVSAALCALEDGETDFVALCAEQMTRRLRDLPKTPEEKQKLFAAMMRLGYANDEIREAYRLCFGSRKNNI